MDNHIMIYNYSGVLYTIKTYNDVMIKFELEENGSYVRSRVAITLNNVTVMTFLPRGVSLPVFWNESDLLSKKIEESHDPDFKDWSWYVFKLRKVKISGSYFIRESDLQVIKNGKVYGHTMLFDDPVKTPQKRGRLHGVSFPNNNILCGNRQ
ncbi:hypothetical protein A7C91_09965 [Thermococcus piezophilus]|uniref:Uncharacterized protein n=2 Tax=Thermococcus piezophilus TaxID=1712654 RepID=A0A172WJI1_9EURY|nr:hypothetical protein A7C91_09965 [Thermococcus piezophilus]